MKKGKTEAPPKQEKCAQRIGKMYAETMADVREKFTAYQKGDDDAREDWFNYGLSFDYVSAGTFRDQEEGYFRYQLSWGGPSDEFRFYVDAGKHVYRIEYWFMDWFDGARVTLEGKDRALMLEVFEDFDSMGVIERELEKAGEDL